MTIFHSLVYGSIQGLTEFLPVSSSAHLILIPFFTKWPDPGLAFDVALHWGTLLAVFIYFRTDVALMLRLFWESLCGKRSEAHTLPWKIALATLPGAVLGYILEKHAESVFRSPALLAGTLSVMGLGLWASDRWGKKEISLEQLSWKHSLLIGLAQGIALVPGVSRSGITIATALFLGFKREAAVRFSFFLAMPITLGAGLLKSGYLLQNITDPFISIGILTSLLSGLAAIHILLTYVKNNSFTPFVLYRLGLAGVVLFMLSLKP
ncbi:MAG: Undecaprenyl-diphosphatase [Elusimicrobia bacterium]|nr:Undecaprenyl-diphosphatase [Elusimicrobiota bacterium]